MEIGTQKNYSSNLKNKIKRVARGINGFNYNLIIMKKGGVVLALMINLSPARDHPLLKNKN